MTDPTAQPSAQPNPYQPFEPLKAPAGTQPGTVWIWLVALLPLTGYLSIFFIDIGGMMRAMLSSPTNPLAMYGAMFTPGVLISTVVGWAGIAGVIIFSVLDYRTLAARGVPKPFHWAFSFFALAGYGIVYAIGRGVVVRARTGTGFTPSLVAILVFVAGFLISIIWSIVAVTQMMSVVPYIPSVPVS